MANSCNHFKALLKKNWILFKRSPCGSCCEIVTPIVFALFLLAVRGLVSKTDVNETSYVDSAVPFPKYPNITTADNQTYQSLPVASKDAYLQALFTRTHLKNCLKMPRGGVIALAPDTNITQEIKKRIEMYPKAPSVQFFNDIDKMNEHVQSNYYGSETFPFLCFGIAFTSWTNGKYEYNIRFNTSTGNPEVYNTISIVEQTVPFVKQSFSKSDLFITSGFLTLQNWVDNIILQLETSDSNSQINANMASVRIPKYINDDIALYLQGSTNIFLVLPLILPFLRMIYRLLYEKEKKIREGMKMMGMTNVSFYASWIVTYVIIYTIICVINAIILTRGFFTHSNGFFIFFFLWFFCIVLIFQSLFVSVFFTRVKSGIIAGIIFFFILYIINYIVSSNEVSFEIKQQASLSSHAAMAFAAETLLLLETNAAGINKDTMRIMVSNYKLETYFAFEFINIVIFSIFSIYLDQVFPNEFGQKKHPLFFIRWIWNRNPQKAKRPGDSPELMDVEMQNINPQASDNIVEGVDGTLKQQEAEGQALLIKNLSKVYPNGKKAVDDLSLNMYQNQIFVLLGHNGAGKTTTISILTGLLSPSSGTAMILGKDIRYNMEDLRMKMGVCPQHDILFDTLTIEEHLRLFATFKGMKPKDIPAEVEKIIEDVDLKAKRFDLAKNLSGGQKRRLSVGMAFIGGSKLILLDEPTSGMDTSARRYIWEMLKNYKNDRIVILTTHFMDEADFLGDRIAIMGEGVLKCCGSSVFLKNKFGVGYNLIIAKKSVDSSPKIEEFVMSMIKTANCISKVAAEISFQLPLAELPNFKDLFLGLDSNMQEFNIASYGISITTLEEVFLKVAEGAQELNKAADKFKQDDAEREAIDDFDLNSVKIKSKLGLFFVHFWAIFLKRLQYFKRDKKGLICEIFIPCLVVGLGLCITFITFLYEAPPLIMSPQILTHPMYIPVQDQYKDSFYTSQNFPGNDYTFVSNQNINNLSPYDFDKYAYDYRNVAEGGLYGYYYISSKSGNTINYIAFYNSTTPFTLPILMNSMNQAFIRSATGREIKVVCYNYPFPLTQRIKSLTGTASGFIASFIYSIAYAFIPASLIVFIVKERQQSIKHQQLVSGVSLLSYWLANYVLDFLKLTIPLVFSVLMCLAFDISAFTDTNESFGAMWLIFIFYSSAMISFTYFVSFLFKDYGNAQAFSFVFAFLISAVVSLVLLVLRLVPSSREGAKIAQYFLRIIPSFCFGYGIVNVANRNLYAILEKYYVAKGALDTDIAGWDVIYLAIESVVYMLLVFILEKLLVMPKFLNIFSRETSIPYEKIEYDNDVEAEMKRVEETGPSDYTVYVKDLRKVYMLGGGKKKVAVTKTSFGIPNGECFGLLGVNGAGKTTTFKMLCGEIPPTSGTAFVNGFDVSTQLDKAREHIGYCPQFDALLENLTAKEHLFLYAAIKGIPYNMRKELVEKKLVEMNLKKYENVCAGTYSGGNKRKLSVAIAMLGNPPIVFLDEPSTGMDPEARRFMWNVISRISTTRKRSSIILTTHSMEEAEALSTRISIMVNGTLKCLGSVQHIKNKFGKGYEIEIKTVLPDAERISAALASIGHQRGERVFTNGLPVILEKLGKSHFLPNFQMGKSASHLALELIKSNGLAIEVLIEYTIIEDFGAKIMAFLEKDFGSFTVLEHFQSFYRFKLNAIVSIGKLFGSFEDHKEALHISQYSIKQATIEQIFNMFANEQDNQLMEYAENAPLQIPLVKKTSVLEELELEKQKQELESGVTAKRMSANVIQISSKS